jgi:hypothetical protein
VPGATALPHSPQNFWPSGLTVPQVGHRLARRAPQSPQNFCPPAFSCPHSGQVVTGVASPERPADAEHGLHESSFDDYSYAAWRCVAGGIALSSRPSVSVDNITPFSVVAPCPVLRSAIMTRSGVPLSVPTGP